MNYHGIQHPPQIAFCILTWLIQLVYKSHKRKILNYAIEVMEDEYDRYAEMNTSDWSFTTEPIISDVKTSEYRARHRRKPMVDLVDGCAWAHLC